MSYAKTAFMMMVALALPHAAGALGLGEIHVDSALNEPLVAEIDIVGATQEDLLGITASIANQDIFLRFGVDRPAFLSTVTFKITRYSKGRSILAIRSTGAFTEPLVDMLVDLRWHGGEMIRQYTLLLDPPAFPSTTRIAEAVPASASPSAQAPRRAERTSSTSGEAVTRKTIKVGARATLRAVVWRAGARGDAELKRMMIAIFRANPNGFAGNINRLRRGALLAIPSAANVSAISMAEANREFDAQMGSWHAMARFAGSAKAVAIAEASPVARAPSRSGEATGSPEPTRSAEPAPAESAPDTAALNRRVQTLEKGLEELQDLLDRERDNLVLVQATVAHDEKTAETAVVAPKTTSRQAVGFSIAAALALLATAFWVLRARHRRPTPTRVVSPAAAPQETGLLPVVAATKVDDEVRPVAVAREPRRDRPAEDRPTEANTMLAAHMHGDIDVESLEASYLCDAEAATAELPATALPAAATEMGDHDANAETMPVEALDSNLFDLDATAQHVQMPSKLHENTGFKERRTSLVDALKLAVEREPHRRDLRMKLLETYYAAAVTNRQGFLDVVQELARERDKTTDGEWDRIVRMGRQIAADSDFFALDTAGEDDEDLANCA